MNAALENLGYYRSRLVSINNSVNPLVAAATPLLLIAEKLNTLDFNSSHEQLLADLTHEIKAFENKAQMHNYPPTTIAHARYVLSALIDELILQTIWGKNKHHATGDGNQFFVILEQALQDPATNLHLLELIYLALSFGYEGQYRLQDNKHYALNTLIDNLYNTIRQRQHNSDKQLLIAANAVKATPLKKIRWAKIIRNLGIGIIGLNLILYLGVNYQLNVLANPMLSMIKQHNDTVRTIGDKL